MKKSNNSFIGCNAKKFIKSKKWEIIQTFNFSLSHKKMRKSNYDFFTFKIKDKNNDIKTLFFSSENICYKVI